MMRHLLLLLSLGTAFSATAQVVVDVDIEQLKNDAGELTLADMSVNDTVYFYRGLCVKDGLIYAPSSINVLDLAAVDSEATGVILRARILPARELAVTIVDAAQAQMIAKGQVSAPVVLTDLEYANAVLGAVRFLLDPAFSSSSCDIQAMWRPLVQHTLYTVSTINEQNSLSGLLASVSGQLQ